MVLARTPEALRAGLAALDDRALRRRRVTAVARYDDAAERPQAAHLQIDGQHVVNFCGNDYLGLATHPALIAAMSAAAGRYGAGSGASHLVTGHGPEHAALEQELAEFTQRERALLFSSGYMANLGVLGSLVDRHDLMLQDQLNHASLLDAGLLSRATLRRYPHLDAAAARERLRDFRAARPQAGALIATDGVFSMDGDVAPLGALRRHRGAGSGAARERLRDFRAARPQAGALIATDGVFSMDGDVAPLGALATLARQSGAWLLVDDAHGLGVLGERGGGAVEAAGLSADDVPVLIGTLGKALGSFGAFVAGDADLIETLLQRARTYIYTTALPQPVAAATRAALRLVQRESWRREQLRTLTQRFRERAGARGIALGVSQTPIQPVILGSAETALAASEALRYAGFWVVAIRPPTVPEGSARLRITLSAAHTEAEVDALVVALDAALHA